MGVSGGVFKTGEQGVHRQSWQVDDKVSRG